jgi:hypothetical protein
MDRKYPPSSFNAREMAVPDVAELQTERELIQAERDKEVDHYMRSLYGQPEPHPSLHPPRSSITRDYEEPRDVRNRYDSQYHYIERAPRSSIRAEYHVPPRSSITQARPAYQDVPRPKVEVVSVPYRPSRSRRREYLNDGQDTYVPRYRDRRYSSSTSRERYDYGRRDRRYSRSRNRSLERERRPYPSVEHDRFPVKISNGTSDAATLAREVTEIAAQRDRDRDRRREDFDARLAHESLVKFTVWLQSPRPRYNIPRLTTREIIPFGSTRTFLDKLFFTDLTEYPFKLMYHWRKGLTVGFQDQMLEISRSEQSDESHSSAFIIHFSRRYQDHDCDNVTLQIMPPEKEHSVLRGLKQYTSVRTSWLIDPKLTSSINTTWRKVQQYVTELQPQQRQALQAGLKKSRHHYIPRRYDYLDLSIARAWESKDKKKGNRYSESFKHRKVYRVTP